MNFPMRRYALVAGVVALTGCGQALSAGADEPSAAALARFLPREDGWQNDPANQAHPNDPNPLRRKLGDAPIKSKLFALTDLRVYTACVKQHAGQKLDTAESSYVGKCPALQQTLIGRAQAAGFIGVSVDDVFDPQLVHLSGR